jgi:hypothetical protein
MTKKKGRPTPPPSDPNPSGTPLQAPLPPNRQVSVYRLGRLLNQIDWHAQQAWLRMNHQHADSVEQLLDDLSLEARAAVPERARAGVEAAIVRHRDWWVRGYDHSDHHHHQTLLAVNERINEILESQEVDIAQARAEAFWLIFPDRFHMSLREVVVGFLLEGEVPFLNLGEGVDQGIRPGRVSEWLYDPDIPAPPRNTTPGRREPFWFVANRGWEPGELPPDRRWPARVRKLWREAGLLGELPANILPDADNLDQEAIPGCVEAVDAAICHALSPPALVPSPAPDAQRVVIDWGSHTVIVDGRVLARVDNPTALRLFEHIALDQGELVTSNELKQLPGCRGRIDRLINKSLPEEVRALIRSKGGRAGGYWLHLPRRGP